MASAFNTSATPFSASSVTGEHMEDLMYHWKTQGFLPNEVEIIQRILGLKSSLSDTFHATMGLGLNVYDDIRIRLVEEAEDWEEIAAWHEVFTIRRELHKHTTSFDPPLMKLCVMVTQLLPARMSKRAKKPGRKIDDVEWYKGPLQQAPSWYQDLFQKSVVRHMERSRLRMEAREATVRLVCSPVPELVFAARSQNFKHVDISEELEMRIFGKMEPRKAKPVGLLDILPDSL